MTKAGYREARKALGYSVQDWVIKLGISMDTHKSYNSGRREIQKPVVNHIETLITTKNG